MLPGALLALACAPLAQPPLPPAPLPEPPAESPPPAAEPTPDLPRAADADIASLRERGLLLPVKGAVLSKIPDTFDAPRDGGRRHDAVDIMAPRGTAIVAAEDGTVLHVGTNTLGGNVIWAVDREQRFVFYYAHLERYARGLHDGQALARGDVIGYVGTTGNAPPDAPHLHFQVMRLSDIKHYWDGAPVNPLPFLVEPTVSIAPKTATPRPPFDLE